MSAADALTKLREAILYIQASKDGPVQNGVACLLYQPHPKLGGFLTELDAYRGKVNPTKAEREEAGYLLEKIAYLAFKGLVGVGTIKNFTSSGPQYDLYVSGTDGEWLAFAEFVRINRAAPGVVVECKAEEKPVDDATMARVCAILEQNLSDQASLGVFFTLSGVTGMPAAGAAAQKKIGQARLRQVVFHARTGRAVVAFDPDDIMQLNDPGALPMLLFRKIEDIGTLPGIVTAPLVVLVDTQLPKHLASL